MNRLRWNLKKENMKKTKMIRLSWKEEKRFEPPEILARYKDAKVFREDADYIFKPGEVLGPVIVGEDACLLSKDDVIAFLLFADLFKPLPNMLREKACLYRTLPTSERLKFNSTVLGSLQTCKDYYWLIVTLLCDPFPIICWNLGEIST